MQREDTGRTPSASQGTTEAPRSWGRGPEHVPEGASPADALVSGFVLPDPRDKKKFLLPKPPGLWYFVMQPQQTSSVPTGPSVIVTKGQESPALPTTHSLLTAPWKCQQEHWKERNDKCRGNIKNLCREKLRSKGFVPSYVIQRLPCSRVLQRNRTSRRDL